MTEKAEAVAAQIRDFFLHEGKWEVDDDGWLWLYDANYGFDPKVLAAAWCLREAVALASARRILTEIASHDKIGEEYHDAVVDIARSWMKLYG